MKVLVPTTDWQCSAPRRTENYTDFELAGPVAQYGRGIVHDVSSQLTQDFAAQLQARLADLDEAHSSDPTRAATPQDDGAAKAAPRTTTAPSVSGARLVAVVIKGWFRRLFRRPRAGQLPQ